MLGKHEIKRFEIFAGEVRVGQGKKKASLLFLLPVCQGTSTLPYYAAKDWFIQGQIPPVTPSYNSSRSTFTQENMQAEYSKAWCSQHKANTYLAHTQSCWCLSAVVSLGGLWWWCRRKGGGHLGITSPPLNHNKVRRLQTNGLLTSNSDRLSWKRRESHQYCQLEVLRSCQDPVICLTLGFCSIFPKSF